MIWNQELHDTIEILEDVRNDLSKWSAYHEDCISDEVIKLEGILGDLRDKEQR